MNRAFNADLLKLVGYLLIDTQEKKPTEIAGARELLDSMTMYDLLEAEVEGR